MVEIYRLVPVVREGRGGYEGISESGETEDQSEHVSVVDGELKKPEKLKEYTSSTYAITLA